MGSVPGSMEMLFGKSGFPITIEATAPITQPKNFPEAEAGISLPAGRDLPKRFLRATHLENPGGIPQI